MMEKKRGWLVFPVFLVALTLTTLACSSESEKTTGSAETSAPTASAPGATAPGPSAGATSKEASGEVVAVNPMQKTLVVKSTTGEMTFDVKESAASDLNEVKPGDTVTVLYSEVGGKYSAEAIRKG